MSRLYLFDVDGTVIRSFMREDGGADPYDRVEVLPGRVETFALLTAMSHRVAFCTNQGGVAFGFQTRKQVRDKMVAVLDALELPVNPNVQPVLSDEKRRIVANPAQCYVALRHPKAKVPELVATSEHRWRKPLGGMIRAAMADYSVTQSQTMYVGDMESDRQAANNAGVPYADAEDFFHPSGLDLMAALQRMEGGPQRHLD